MLGLYVYASTVSIMTAALLYTPLCHIPYEVIDADEGDIIRITKAGEISRGHFQPTLYTPYKVSFNSETSDTDAGFDLLLDMCGYFGVSEEEVRYLIDMGYSYDEIEEFLLNPSLLDEEYFYSEL